LVAAAIHRGAEAGEIPLILLDGPDDVGFAYPGGLDPSCLGDDA